MAEDEKISPIQQKDLARILNVSTMTVSKALRGHSDVSKATRKRVQELARKMDYRPNFVARNLSAKKTFTIGVIMPKIAHSFYSAVLDGVQTVAENKGYEIILAVSRENAAKEEKHFLSLISTRVDGLLLSVTQETVSVRFEEIDRMGIPLVFFDRALDTMAYSSVKVDDREGAAKAVEHAISMGYKKIVHFAGYQNVDISRNRREGYLDALRKHQIPVDDKMIIECGFGEQVGYKAFMEIYQKGNLPEVIFTVSDSVAVGVYKAAKETDLKIGRDIGIIGFTDINVASILSPPLTTVHEPAELMGKKAVSLLIEEIENEEKQEIQKISLPTELKIRESCGEPYGGLEIRR
jgi:LacI family transcriptional regulator